MGLRGASVIVPGLRCLCPLIRAWWNGHGLT